MPASKRHDLRSWLGIFHPAYRSYLFGLLGIGLVSGIVTYFNLELLQSLVKTFAVISELDGMSCAQAANIHILTQFLVCNEIGSGWVVALLVLLVYAGLELMQAALGVIRLYMQGLLEIRSRNDIEREVLVNLLRKDDQFFQRHSATQIANRLSEDTSRIFERREDISELWSVSVQALGALFFLWTQHWSYAAAVLVFSLAGVYIIHRMLGRMKFLDGAQLQADDNVKASFEDYLYAAPEAQMGNLTGKITNRLGKVQGERQTAFMGLVTLTSKLTATYALTQLVAFGAIMCAIIYVVIVHGFTLEDGLVAAVVRAVPQLYGNISQVAKLFLKFQLADVSARRLLEYETFTDDLIGGDAETVPVSGQIVAPLVMENVRYAFTPGGPAQGGRDGISLTIEPNTLNVVVGPSGSGKSMLTQLIMGRLKSLEGKISLGEGNIGEMNQHQRSGIFSYMPQTLAMIAGTIEENIRFGRHETGGPDSDELDEEMLEWIDKSAVGRFTREKALDMCPGDINLDGFAGQLKPLREDLRARVTKEAGVSLKPFADNPVIPHLTVIEMLSGSAAETEKMLRLSFSPHGFRAMDHLARLPGADKVIDFGRHVIEQSMHMLERCPSYDAYSEIAPFAITPPVWELRSRFSEEGALGDRNPAVRGELLLAGLTATPREADADTAKVFAEVARGPELAELRKAVHAHYADALESLSEDQVNGALNWRDNLLFAAPETDNMPTARAVDTVLLNAVADTELDRLLLQTGLQYEVGRQGKRLSGGQRQLICLCRAFLQGCPVMVFDEPTAALDPRRRREINALLREAAGQRTIIAITHDAELAKLADQVIMIKEGQLAAAGKFAELARSNADFRNLTNLREEAAQ